MDKYNLDHYRAGWYSGIIVISSLVLCPFMGKLIDYIGNAPLMIIIGSAMVIPSYLVMIFTNASPIGSMIVMGLALSLVPSALWPCVSLLIKPTDVSTAYGFMVSF
eukprot:TRINITY_DN10507_c0_g1_i1.p1 TRINITY_DN10507_c0_g1~~TRINITY_DN10507_c0_g1_i1.p1  ORF type:complete len:106 (+),score=0.04 TRINITY_DN10507_c0_g1_i1:53-370(+)